MVIEGVLESIAIEITKKVECPTIGIGASAQCDGQVLVTDDMLGMFERVPKFVKRYQDMAGVISGAVKDYAEEVRSEEHTSELQSLMRISSAVFCLKKKKQNTHHQHNK